VVAMAPVVPCETAFVVCDCGCACLLASLVTLFSLPIKFSNSIYLCLYVYMRRPAVGERPEECCA
jgi:hypothetical protein